MIEQFYLQKFQAPQSAPSANMIWMHPGFQVLQISVPVSLLVLLQVVWSILKSINHLWFLQHRRQWLKERNQIRRVTYEFILFCFNITYLNVIMMRFSMSKPRSKPWSKPRSKQEEPVWVEKTVHANITTNFTINSTKNVINNQT